MNNKRTNVPLECNFESNEIQVIESHHDFNFQMQWTTHSFNKLILPIAGSGNIEVESGKKLSIDSQSAWCIPSGMKHRIVDHERKQLSLWILCISTHPTNAVLNAAKVWKKPNAITSPPLLSKVKEAISSLLIEQQLRNQGFELSIQAQASTLLLAIERSQKNTSARPLTPQEKIHQYLENLPYHINQKQTLDEVAQKLNLSPKSFSNYFREITNTSWLQHLTNARIKYASSLLKETDRSIISIAYEAGFDDLSHFHRVFKKRTGMTPKECRVSSNKK